MHSSAILFTVLVPSSGDAGRPHPEGSDDAQLGHIVYTVPVPSSIGDAGRPHPEGPDDAQLGLHQAIRGGDEGVGGQAHLHAGQQVNS